MTRKRFLMLPLAAAAFVVAVVLSHSVAQAGFTASMSSNTNRVGTGTSFLTAQDATNQHCTSVPASTQVPATSVFPCTGTQLPTLAAAGETTKQTTLTASGTTNFTSATYDVASCAPVKLNNLSQSTNPMLVRGNVAFNQPGPAKLSGSSALGFNGTDTLAADVAQSSGLTSFTLGIWFKTATPQGAMFGFSNSPSQATSTTYDRNLYLTSTGRVGFSTNSGGAKTVLSSPTTKNYADNAWHYAVIVGESGVGLLGLYSQITMYVDNVQVGSFNALLSSVANTNPGWWRVGQARANEGGYSGNGQYFNGSLSNFTVFPSALTAAQITELYNTTSQTTHQTVASSYGVRNLWALNDSGLEAYTGALPNNATNPCAHVNSTVSYAGNCLYPAGAGNCPTTATTTLASIASSPAVAVPAGTSGSSQNIIYKVSKNASYAASYDVGLHLLLPATVEQKGFNQAFVWSGNKVII